MNREKPNKSFFNGICKEIPLPMFRRFKFVAQFKEADVAESSLVYSYVPRIINSCSTSYKLPKDRLDVEAFRKITKVPGCTPYFKQPNVPSRLPVPLNFVETTYPSLIPLLITAQHSGIDAKAYHFVTKRNSLRVMGMDSWTFDINVVRLQSTIFLKRFENYSIFNTNSTKYCFEQMCTECNSTQDYNQLSDGQVGDFKILTLGETDALDKDNDDAILLKILPNVYVNQYKKSEWWLQAYLGM